MKKIISLVLALCAAWLTGCGGSGITVDPDKQEYVVGICQLATHDSLDQATLGFKDALTEALAAAGRTVVFQEQNGQGDTNTCVTIVNSFVSDKVDLIMANATPALQAAYNATETIPVLGTSITEYGVALDIADFTGVVESNVSGTSDRAPLEAQTQMLIDVLALPSGASVGILYCSAEPNSAYQYAVVSAFLAGAIAGILTGLFHTLLGIPGILSGILTQLILWSVNLKILGKANMAISSRSYDVLLTSANNPVAIAVGVCFCALLIVDL